MDNARLTIGMATFDDFDGVYFTATSLMIHHREVMDQCRILVVDNNPRSKQGRASCAWVRNRVPNGEYHPFPGPTGTSQARNEVFRRASTPAVLCLDSHVLLAPGAIGRLLDYHAANPECRDLLTGPLLSDSGRVVATHQRPQWSSGAWGVWELDPRGKDPDGLPFPIWQQGMGLFSCRRDAWVGFHPEFRGFGGCESYVMEKFRRAGGQVLCCPWLRWTHRFQRPDGVPYPLLRKDRLRNYLIGFRELGLDVQPVLDAYRQHTGGSRSQEPPAGDRSAAFAVIGDLRFGGVRMRGRILAEHLGCKLIGPSQVPGMARRDTIVAIKNGPGSRSIRGRCERLVYDPLDSFYADGRAADPVEYWRSAYDQMRFDDIVATSPACRDVMRLALPPRVRVHLVPHQCDAGVDESWRDPDGPVVYAGVRAFIDSGLERIEEACRMIGKRFVMETSCDVLKGASLVLSLRLPPFDRELNRHCKPQIKLENAAAAGLPAVTTDCPAALSRFPGVPHVRCDFTASQLAAAMRRALDGPGLADPFRDADYLAAMDRLLGRGSTVVIYTAIFGGRDALHDPREVSPGVRYVCFTDNPRLTSKVWEIRYRRPTGEPLMQAKRHKILAHEVLDCAASVWIDGHVELHRLDDVPGRLKRDLALLRHPARDCIYKEAERCRQIGRGDPEKIAAAVSRYQDEGHPARYGLWMGGIIVRRHTRAVRSFNAEWWREVTSGTPRDQISLPVVLRRLGIPFETLPRGRIDFRVKAHLR